MIRLAGVGKQYDDRWIFRGVNVEVRSRESWVILGPSGAGKSVLLKMLAGLVAPDEGSVEVRSESLGVLFQANALFNSLTVAENLLLPLRECKGMRGTEARLLASRWLEDVGLPGTEDLYPDALSGGMQKRLGIARALILEPELVLCDEPTAGLDPITSRMIADLLLKLKARGGTTLVAVTTDVQRAYQLGDRVGFMAQGRWVDGGTPADVRAGRDPMLTQFTRGLLDGPLRSELA